LLKGGRIPGVSRLPVAGLAGVRILMSIVIVAVLRLGVKVGGHGPCKQEHLGDGNGHVLNGSENFL
jgi:hypothetical protein